MRNLLVIFAILQPILAYHHGFRTGYATWEDSREELPQNYHEYINFDNSDQNNRPNRQISSGGFNWDSPSDNTRRFSGNNWNRDPDSSDSFIFEDDFESRNFLPRTTQRPPSRRRRPTTQRTPTSTVAIPGMGTPRTPCEDRCLSTPEYNPVCGDDNMTYFSRYRLSCAQKCGKRVKLKHFGACSLIPPRG